MTLPDGPGLLLVFVTTRSALAVTEMFAVAAVLLVGFGSSVLPALTVALLMMVPTALALSTSMTVDVVPFAIEGKVQVTVGVTMMALGTRPGLPPRMGPPVQLPAPLGVAET